MEAMILFGVSSLGFEFRVNTGVRKTSQVTA